MEARTPEGRVPKPRNWLAEPNGSNALSFSNMNRRFKFQKSRQLFIRTHSKTLSVAAMRVCNPDSFVRENQRLRRTPSKFN